jgi:hypothetical protein
LFPDSCNTQSVQAREREREREREKRERKRSGNQLREEQHSERVNGETDKTRSGDTKTIVSRSLEIGAQVPN